MVACRTLPLTRGNGANSFSRTRAVGSLVSVLASTSRSRGLGGKPSSGMANYPCSSMSKLARMLRWRHNCKGPRRTRTTTLWWLSWLLPTRTLAQSAVGFARRPRSCGTTASTASEPALLPLARRYAQGSICPCCQTQLNCRERLIKHLEKCWRCLDACIRTGEPLESDVFLES